MILLSLVLAAAATYWYYRKTVPDTGRRLRLTLAGLRFLTLFLALLLLLNPVLSWLRHFSHKPVVLVLNDVSASMDEKLGTTTKGETIRSLLPALQEKCEKRGYEVKTVSFADGLDDKSKQTTQLFKTLAELRKNNEMEHTEAVVLLSDGWLKDDDFSALNATEVPFYPVQGKIPANRTDLEVRRVVTNRTAFRGEQAPVSVEVSASEYKGGATAQLLIDGKPAESRPVDFSKESFQNIMFEPTFPAQGLHMLEARIESGTDEANRDNNRYPTAIQVMADKTGVLILADRLDWDAKFVKDALITDPKRAVKVCRYDNGTLWDGRNAIPLNQALTPQTVTVVLVNNGNLNLSSSLTEALRLFVDNGGGILVIGQPISGPVFPAIRSNITRTFNGTFRFTPEASNYDTFRLTDAEVRNIPPIDYSYVMPTAQAKILARADNAQQSPLILYQEYGKGKCMVFAGTGLWKWQLEEGSRYRQMMSDLAMWLGTRSGNRFVALTDKNGYLLGEEPVVRLSAFDERMNPIPDLSAHIIVRDAAGKAVFDDFLTKDGDEYKIRVSGLKSGRYRFELADTRADRKTNGEFVVSDLSAESRDRGINLPLLSLIAHATGGSLLSDGNSLPLPEVKPVREERRLEYPLYRKWWVISLFLAAFCSEIYLRKRAGLA
jgi:hypothetical protein